MSRCLCEFGKNSSPSSRIWDGFVQYVGPLDVLLQCTDVVDAI